MGIVKKQGLSNTIIYYVGVLLGYYNMIIFLPSVLSDEQFGLIRLLFPVASILALFYLLGVPNIIIRFFPYFKDLKRAQQGILFLSLSIASVGIIVFTFIAFLFKDQILNFYREKSLLFIDYYYVAFPLAISLTFFEVFYAYSRAQLRTVFPIFINEIYVRLAVLVLGLLFTFQLITFNWFLGLFITIYFSTSLLLLYYLQQQRVLYIRPRKEILKPSLLKPIGRFGFFSFFGGATGSLVDKIDVLFVGAYIGLTETGIYSVALLIAMTIALPAKALMQILFPLTADAFKEKNYTRLKYLYSTSSSIQLFIGSYILIMIWINYVPFFTLFQPKFLPGMVACLIIGVGRLFDMVTGINGMLIINSRYYRYDLIFTSFLVVLTLITNYLFIPAYGMVGAAIATALSIFIYNCVKFVFVWRKLNMQPFSLSTLKILIIGFCTIGIGIFIPDTGFKIINIILNTFIISGLFYISIIKFNLVPELKEMILGGFDKARSLSRDAINRK